MKSTQFYPRPQLRFCESSFQNPASVVHGRHDPRHRGPVLSFVGLSFTHCGHAVDHWRAARRADGNSTPGIRPTCRALAIGAIISSGCGSRLCAGAIPARLLLRTLLGATDAQADHERKDLQHQQVHDPVDAVPAALRVEPGAQFSPYEGKALGRGGGVCFHIC